MNEDRKGPQMYCDAQITENKQNFNLHWFVIGFNMLYFHAFFKGNIAESCKNIILNPPEYKLNTEKCMNLCIENCYSGGLDIHSDDFYVI